MKRDTFVCVLILNWNQKKITIDCVDSVLKSRYPDYKVIVIDNGSTDGSVAALKVRFDGRIEVLENRRNLGYARGFNVGLKYAFETKKAEYCLVMNNDTILDDKAISALVRIAQVNTRVGFVTGKVYYYDRPNVLQTVGKREHPIRWNGDHIGNDEEDVGQYESAGELHFADDIFTLVTRRLYEEVGGYDPMFFLQGEEYDWQARAKISGFKIYYTPEARIWHKVSMTLGKDSVLKAYYDAKSPMLVILLHKSPQFFRRYLRYHFYFRILRSTLVYSKRGQLSKALARWRGFFSAIVWGARTHKLTFRHFI
jgi:GT2 family glycosyltransferase